MFNQFTLKISLIYVFKQNELMEIRWKMCIHMHVCADFEKAGETV